MTCGFKPLAAASVLLATLAVAGAASAQSVRPRPEQVRPPAGESLRLGAPASTTTLKFNEKGRWGVDLNLDEPARRERRLNDVEAGAFFRVTPSVRVGGSVRLDDKLKPERITPDDRGARVSVRGKFEF